MQSLQPVNGFGFSGMCAELMRKFTERWMLIIPEADPAMLDMFRERDRLPYRELLPWSGEFAGKYLTGAYYLYRATGDTRLKETALRLLDELIACIDDGYLGCYAKNCRLTGAFSQTPDKTGDTWDSWGHYHAMYAMYLWHEETGSPKLWSAMESIAALFVRTFYRGERRLVDIGWSEMNLSVLHIFALLYKKTKRAEYLDFIREVLADVEKPGAGDYVRSMESGLEFYQCPKPRWESLHVVMGLIEASDCLGTTRYSDAAVRIFDSILKTDVHNTGGFSTGEQAVGHPYENGAVELCCVIAYNALATQIYLRTGRADIAQFLEMSYYNAILGSYSPSGRWSTYNTPMDGARRANTQDIVFQARSGSPDLNCCSANSGRGLGQLSDWAFVRNGESVYINFFENCDFTCADGLRVRITGGYPASGRVHISASLPGKTHLFARMGSEYRAIGVETDLTFDMPPRCEAGHRDYEGKVCVYCGPILYGADLRDNEGPLGSLRVDPETMKDAEMRDMPDGRRLLFLPGITLTDFYHLGAGGSEYRTWL